MLTYLDLMMSRRYRWDVYIYGGWWTKEINCLEDCTRWRTALIAGRNLLSRLRRTLTSSLVWPQQLSDFIHSRALPSISADPSVCGSDPHRQFPTVFGANRLWPQFFRDPLMVCLPAPSGDSSLDHSGRV